MSYTVRKSSGSVFKSILLLTLLALVSLFVYELNQRVNNKQTYNQQNHERDDAAFFRALAHVTGKQQSAPQQEKLLTLRNNAPAGSEIYYWIDDNGDRHYSDTPTSDAEKITLVPNLIHLSD